MTEAADDPGFGRVDADGTVYVRTKDGERVVGQWPDGDPAAALSFYRKRYDGLVVEVDLLEQRIKAGALSPDDATSTVSKVKRTVAEAQAVGDLDALTARLEALEPLITATPRGAQGRTRREGRGGQAGEADDRRGGGEARGRATTGATERTGCATCSTSWKSLPRIDKASDDELWHRFSSARTAYTRRRKQHFSELNEKRDGARVVKEKLVVEAEALADSTDWGATARAYRDLMGQWKAAGPAQKDVDDALWKRFRTAQDTFFGARDAENAKLDTEYAANAEVKRALLVEAEKLVPVDELQGCA